MKTIISLDMLEAVTARIALMELADKQQAEGESSEAIDRLIGRLNDAITVAETTGN